MPKPILLRRELPPRSGARSKRNLNYTYCLIVLLLVVTSWWRTHEPRIRVGPSAKVNVPSGATVGPKPSPLSARIPEPFVTELTVAETVDLARNLRLQIPPDKVQVRKVEIAVQRFSDAELDQLTAQTLDTGNDMDTRWTTLHLLHLAGARAMGAFERIALAPIPAALDNLRQREVTLHISALENLDELGAQGLDVKDALMKATLRTEDPTVQMMSIIALRGVEQGRPGKLGRYIDSQLKGSP